MSNTYSQANQIHALSLAANAAFGKTFSSFDVMQQYVQTVITTVLTDDQGPATATNNYLGSAAAGTNWIPVWGPFVFSNDPNAVKVVCDNTMALFYNASQKLFVVAIAGTNADSTYDWSTEDFEVGTMVAWNTVSPNTQAPATAEIATGTSVGLNNLLKLADNNGNNVVAAIKNYLNTLGSTNGITVAVCGHSLGGALTPVMALYLFENVAQWNQSSQVNSIGAYPTAGPTPGNADFATYYNNLVDNNTTPNPIAFTFSYIYNTIDMVPQAWQLTNIMNVPFLYDSYQNSQGKPADAMIGAVVSGVICSSFNTSGLHPKTNNYTRINPTSAPCQSFTGTYMKGMAVANGNFETLKIWTAINVGISYIFNFNTTLSSSALNGNNATSTVYPNYLIDFGNFMLQAIYQHTTAYNSNTLMNIEGFAAEFAQIKSTIPGANTGAFNTPEGIAASHMIGKRLGLKNLDVLGSIQYPNS